MSDRRPRISSIRQQHRHVKRHNRAETRPRLPHLQPESEAIPQREILPTRDRFGRTDAKAGVDGRTAATAAARLTNAQDVRACLQVPERESLECRLHLLQRRPRCILCRRCYAALVHACCCLARLRSQRFCMQENPSRVAAIVDSVSPVHGSAIGSC